MSEEWKRIRTDHGEVAHMAKKVYSGGYWEWRTLCGRNLAKVSSDPNRSLCWRCASRAQEQGIAAKP